MEQPRDERADSRAIPSLTVSPRLPDPSTFPWSVGVERSNEREEGVSVGRRCLSYVSICLPYVSSRLSCVSAVHRRQRQDRDVGMQREAWLRVEG